MYIESNALILTPPPFSNPSRGKKYPFSSHRLQIHVSASLMYYEDCLQTLSSQLYMYFTAIKTDFLILIFRQIFIRQYSVQYI